MFFVFLIIVTSILTISLHSFFNSFVSSPNHFSNISSRYNVSSPSFNDMCNLFIKSFLDGLFLASAILAHILVPLLNSCEAIS